MVRTCVPETPVDKDGHSGSREEHVRTSAGHPWKRSVDPVAKPTAVGLTSDEHLRSGVPPAGGAHPLAYRSRGRNRHLLHPASVPTTRVCLQVSRTERSLVRRVPCPRTKKRGRARDSAPRADVRQPCFRPRPQSLADFATTQTLKGPTVGYPRSIWSRTSGPTSRGSRSRARRGRSAQPSGLSSGSRRRRRSPHQLARPRLEVQRSAINGGQCPHLRHLTILSECGVDGTDDGVVIRAHGCRGLIQPANLRVPTASCGPPLAVRPT
ncbi:hypothetical protein BJ983_000284 [Actinomycetospora corticicola]|uniref:Uncharacterized protein n=1 Tax=Actinomycetospora corticicola TaxID=663602 RepID=A0A7Y9DRI5_9PSEU|nr:hypothetical protein [Actinomycetospora corticicola]